MQVIKYIHGCTWISDFQNDERSTQHNQETVIIETAQQGSRKYLPSFPNSLSSFLHFDENHGKNFFKEQALFVCPPTST